MSYFSLCKSTIFLLHLLQPLISDARPSPLVLSVSLEAVGVLVCLCKSPYCSTFSKTCEIILENNYPLLISTLPPIPLCGSLANPQTKKSWSTTSCTVASISYPIPTPLLPPVRPLLSPSTKRAWPHTKSYIFLFLFWEPFPSLPTVPPRPPIFTTPYFSVYPHHYLS